MLYSPNPPPFFALWASLLKAPSLLLNQGPCIVLLHHNVGARLCGHPPDHTLTALKNDTLNALSERLAINRSLQISSCPKVSLHYLERTGLISMKPILTCIFHNGYCLLCQVSSEFRIIYSQHANL